VATVQVSLQEFGDFFRQLKHHRGATVVAVVLAYLEANVDRMLQDDELLSLPLASLLYEDWQADELDPVTSPEAELDAEQMEDLYELFRMMVAAKGTVDQEQGMRLVTPAHVAELYGAGANSIFHRMDVDQDGAVSMMEWLQFFATMCQERGHQATTYKIKQLQRVATSLQMTKQMVGIED